MSYTKSQAINGMANAVRPWQSVDALYLSEDERLRRRYVPRKQVDQREIDACLSCPFATCEGTARKCRTFRAKFKAEAGSKA